MKHLKYILLCFFTALLIISCAKKDDLKKINKEEIFSSVNASESFTVNFAINSKDNDVAKFMDGQFQIMQKNKIRSVTGFVNINDEREIYKEYIDFANLKRYFYIISDKKWETSDVENVNTNLLNILNDDVSIAENQNEYILSGQVPYQTFKESIGITGNLNEKQFEFTLPFVMRVNKNNYAVTEIKFELNEEITDEDMQIQKFEVTITPNISDKEIIIPDEVFETPSDENDENANDDESKILEEPQEEEIVYEEIDSLPMYSIGTFSLEEIRMIVSDELNETYPEDVDFYNYIKENITEIKTLAAEDTKDFTTDEIIEVLFMMSGFMNEDETLNIKEGVEYEKNEESTLSELNINLNDFNYEPLSIISTLLDNNFTIKNIENFENEEINSFNEVYAYLLDSKKNNIYITFNKDEEKDIKEYMIKTIGIPLNVENTVNGTLSINNVSLGTTVENVENVFGKPYINYKKDKENIYIYKNETIKLSLIFDDDILTKIFISTL